MSNYAEQCPMCKKGQSTHGSIDYTYFSCGHAYDKRRGKMISRPSPYDHTNPAASEEEQTNGTD
mgnify:CR=1 FL=1